MVHCTIYHHSHKIVVKHFENVKKIAGHITTVPGGVGPMTITMLLYNVLKSAKNTI